MGSYLVDTVNQKFELRKLKVFFHSNDTLYAETIFNALDQTAPTMKEKFGLNDEPGVEVYLYPDAESFEKTGQKPFSMGEFVRIIFEDEVLLMCVQQLPSNLAEEASKHFCYLVFNNIAKEKELSLKSYRTPSWLREGICSQVFLKHRPDWNTFLLNGWTQLQENEKKDSLIRPSMMVKYIGMIPDPARRMLAFYQSHFMVKFLFSIYPDKFFRKYATLMGAIQDMEAETAFMQVTGYDFEKFFNLFREWVRTTNIWVAVSD